MQSKLLRVPSLNVTLGKKARYREKGQIKRKKNKKKCKSELVLKFINFKQWRGSVLNLVNVCYIMTCRVLYII